MAETNEQKINEKSKKYFPKEGFFMNKKDFKLLKKIAKSDGFKSKLKSQ